MVKMVCFYVFAGADGEDGLCFYVFAGADGEDGLCFCLQVLMVKMVCVFVCRC